jgi:hypothetical protein
VASSKINKKTSFRITQLAAIAGLLLVGGVVYVIASHAGGRGVSYYKPPLSTPKNVVVKLAPNNSSQPTANGVYVSWNRPSDWSKVKVYKLLKNGAPVGYWGVDGAKTPARTATFFQGSFTSADKLTIQSETDSAPATAVWRVTGSGY